MEASLQPLENSGKDGGVANVGTRIFEMTPDPLQAGIPPSQGPALLSWPVSRPALLLPLPLSGNRV